MRSAYPDFCASNRRASRCDGHYAPADRGYRRPASDRRSASRPGLRCHRIGYGRCRTPTVFSLIRLPNAETNSADALLSARNEHISSGRPAGRLAAGACRPNCRSRRQRSSREAHPILALRASNRMTRQSSLLSFTILLAVATLACTLPAWGASGLDALQALRVE